jgi:short chain dehydrogenase
VNNAAVFHLLDSGEAPSEVWRKTLDVNLTGAYLVMWAVKDSMIARRFGRIVNLSSIGGLRPRPRSIAYSCRLAGSRLVPSEAGVLPSSSLLQDRSVNHPCLPASELEAVHTGCPIFLHRSRQSFSSICTGTGK